MSSFQSDAFQSDAWQIAGGVTVLVLDCDPGSYLIDGEDADLIIAGSLVLACDPGSYAITGAPLGFEIGDGLLDPKYSAKRRRYPNIEFRAPPRKKRQAEPVVAKAPAASAPRPRASGLLLGLIDALHDLPIVPPIAEPPAFEAEEADISGPLDLLGSVVLVPEPVPAPPPVDLLAELEARMLERITALQAEVSQLRAAVAIQTEPVQPLRDPMADALQAILPALREPIALEPPVDRGALRRENQRRARELAEVLLSD